MAIYVGEVRVQKSARVWRSYYSKPFVGRPRKARNEAENFAYKVLRGFGRYSVVLARRTNFRLHDVTRQTPRKMVRQILADLKVKKR